MEKYFQSIIEESEKIADSIFKLQVMDVHRQDYGGIQMEKRYVEPKLTILAVSSAVPVYLQKNSQYYRNVELFFRINLALDYVRAMQREDGTFDLLSCNFYAAPDTAFCLYHLIPSYRLLLKMGFDDGCEMLAGKMLAIIRDAARGMATGGFHTPNHRWAIASELTRCANILKDETLKEKASEYLKEGIDINEDGEYSERSAAIYNTVNNAAMITLYEETGDETYLKYVCRNLEMMLTYLEPDGSIFTSNSTRQDRGERIFPRDYFYQYLYVAEKYHNKAFEAAAHQIIRNLTTGKGPGAPLCLDLLMNHDSLCSYPLMECGFPEEYHKYYRESGVVRARKGDLSYSLVKENSRFLFFQSGSLVMHMRIGASYFEHRFFKIQEIQKEGDSYILSFRARGWYYMPFKEAPETSDWWKMENEKREKIYKKDLVITVTVTEREKGLDVRIQAGGCDRVPLRVEIGVPAGSLVDSGTFYIESTAGEAVLVRDGHVTVTDWPDKISIGPGFGTHQFISGKFGSDPRGAGEFTLYYTDFTDFDRVIHIGKVY